MRSVIYWGTEVIIYTFKATDKLDSLAEIQYVQSCISSAARQTTNTDFSPDSVLLVIYVALLLFMLHLCCMLKFIIIVIVSTRYSLRAYCHACVLYSHKHPTKCVIMRTLAGSHQCPD